MKSSNFLSLPLMVKVSFKLAIMFLSLIFLSKCSHKLETPCTEDCYTVEGFVYDESTSEGLKGATVYLWYNDPGWSFSKDPIVTTITDENGFYSLRYASADYINGTGQMAIVAEKDGYLSYPIEPSAYSVKTVEIREEPPVVRNIDLAPSAEINYNIIINATNLDDLEYVWCIASWESKSTDVFAYDLKNDTVFIDQIAADRTVDIWCRYEKNQNVTEERSTIVIPKGERNSIDFVVR